MAQDLKVPAEAFKCFSSCQRAQSKTHLKASCFPAESQQAQLGYWIFPGHGVKGPGNFCILEIR